MEYPKEYSDFMCSLFNVFLSPGPWPSWAQHWERHSEENRKKKKTVYDFIVLSARRGGKT